METLPTWFWFCYNLILLATLVGGIINWVRQVYSPMAAITIILSLLVPLVGFVYGVGRGEGLNEIQYVMTQLKERDIWALFIITAHIYFAVWWFLFLNLSKRIKNIPFDKAKDYIVHKFKKEKEA